MTADAADEDNITGTCGRAVREEGRLDVFFANVNTHHMLLLMLVHDLTLLLRRQVSIAKNLYITLLPTRS